MRNWQMSLRRASFRGVPFWVESDSPEGGRRVAVHEVSGGEAAITEDMGRRARTAVVSAYLVGDVSDVAAHALDAACSAPGAALLVLPMDRARMMHCVAFRRNRHRDRAGYVAFDIDLVEAGSAGGSLFGGLGELRDIFVGAAGLALAGLSSLMR